MLTYKVQAAWETYKEMQDEFAGGVTVVRSSSGAGAGLGFAEYNEDGHVVYTAKNGETPRSIASLLKVELKALLRMNRSVTARKRLVF